MVVRFVVFGCEVPFVVKTAQRRIKPAAVQRPGTREPARRTPTGHGARHCAARRQPSAEGGNARDDRHRRHARRCGGPWTVVAGISAASKPGSAASSSSRDGSDPSSGTPPPGARTAVAAGGRASALGPPLEALYSDVHAAISADFDVSSRLASATTARMSLSLPMRNRWKSRAPAGVSRSDRARSAASISCCNLVSVALPSAAFRCAIQDRRNHVQVELRTCRVLVCQGSFGGGDSFGSVSLLTVRRPARRRWPSDLIAWRRPRAWIE